MIDEIILIEKKIEKINEYDAEFDKNISNCYEYLNKENNSIFLKKIYNKLLNLKSLLKKKDIEYLNDIFTLFKLLKINYEKNITNDEELLSAYLSIFITESMTSVIKKKINNLDDDYDVQDSDEVLNKIISNLKKLIMWISINLDISIKIDYVKLREIVFKLLLILIDNSILNTQNINIYTKERKTKKLIFTDFLIYKKDINIFLKKFKVYKKNNIYCIYTNHYSSINEIFKENLYSMKKFELYDESLVEKLCNNWINIDMCFLKEIYEILLNEIHINNNDIIIRYENLLKNYKRMIKEKDTNTMSECSKLISKFENCIRIKNILEFVKSDNDKLYLPFIFDFRGRIYYTSIISPTFYLEFRYVIFKGVYEENISIEENEFSHIIKKHSHMIKKLENIGNVEKINEMFVESILWCLVSTAEIEKSKLGKEVKIEEFIERGISIINNFSKNKNNWEYKDKIKIMQSIKIITEITRGVYRKRLLSKDATASVFQHLVLSLGWKSEKSLKLCNLNSLDTWYDTYQFIVDDFKKNINKVDIAETEFDKYFNRKTLKKIIMTESYSAGLQTCKKYFFKDIKVNEMSNENYEKIYKIFKNFYNYIKKSDLLLNNKPEEILNFFNKNIKKVEYNDGSVVNFEYFTFKEKEMDFYIKNKRSTKKFRILTNEFDNRKFITSIKANYIQSLDASLVRWILKKYLIITIHDCFLIDYINISKILHEANKGMSEKFHILLNNETIEIKSIFLLL